MSTRPNRPNILQALQSYPGTMTRPPVAPVILPDTFQDPSAMMPQVGNLGVDPLTSLDWMPDSYLAGMGGGPSFTTGMNSAVGAAGGGLLGSLSSWLKGSGILNQYNDDGKQTGQGWGGLALGAFQGLSGAALGMGALSNAKKQLAEGQRRYNIDLENQGKMVNADLEDRQRARVAASPNAESVASYMDRNKVRTA
jgi:hypothetical protein